MGKKTRRKNRIKTKQKNRYSNKIKRRSKRKIKRTHSKSRKRKKTLRAGSAAAAAAAVQAVAGRAGQYIDIQYSVIKGNEEPTSLSFREISRNLFTRIYNGDEKVFSPSMGEAALSQIELKYLTNMEEVKAEEAVEEEGKYVEELAISLLTQFLIINSEASKYKRILENTEIYSKTGMGEALLKSFATSIPLILMIPCTVECAMLYIGFMIYYPLVFLMVVMASLPGLWIIIHKMKETCIVDTCWICHKRKGLDNFTKKYSFSWDPLKEISWKWDEAGCHKCKRHNWYYGDKGLGYSDIKNSHIFLENTGVHPRCNICSQDSRVAQGMAGIWDKILHLEEQLLGITVDQKILSVIKGEETLQTKWSFRQLSEDLFKFWQFPPENTTSTSLDEVQSDEVKEYNGKVFIFPMVEADAIELKSLIDMEEVKDMKEEEVEELAFSLMEGLTNKDDVGTSKLISDQFKKTKDQDYKPIVLWENLYNSINNDSGVLNTFVTKPTEKNTNHLSGNVLTGGGNYGKMKRHSVKCAGFTKDMEKCGNWRWESFCLHCSVDKENENEKNERLCKEIIQQTIQKIIINEDVDKYLVALSKTLEYLVNSRAEADWISETAEKLGLYQENQYRKYFTWYNASEKINSAGYSVDKLLCHVCVEKLNEELIAMKDKDKEEGLEKHLSELLAEGEKQEEISPAVSLPSEQER